MGKLTPLLETGQSKPATDKMLILPDSADKLWKGISGDGVFNILSKMVIKTNYIANGDFRISQRFAVGASNTISNLTGRTYGPDRWGITNASASMTYSTFDLGGSGTNVGIGDPSRFASVFRKITATGKIIVSQVIEGTDTLPLRNRVVRFQFMAKNGGISGPILPLRFGLLSLATPGVIDTIPATFVSGFTSAYYDPIWGADLLPLLPILVENGIAQVGGGPAITSPIKQQFGVSALVDRRWRMYSACFTVPANCLNLVPVIWSLGDMAISAATTDELWLTAVGLYHGYETMDWVPRPTEEELKICQRYYCKTFPQITAPVQALGLNTGEFRFIAGLAGVAAQRSNDFVFPVRMRATPPTVTAYNPVVANAQVRDETAVADCSAQAFAGSTDRQTSVTCTGAAGTAVGNLLGVHITADAEL